MIQWALFQNAMINIHKSVLKEVFTISANIELVWKMRYFLVNDVVCFKKVFIDYIIEFFEHV
jgi:hypothetical protein